LQDGREHIAKWSAIFAEGDDAISKEQFCERLAGIKFEMPLGPAGKYFCTSVASTFVLVKQVLLY